MSLMLDRRPTEDPQEVGSFLYEAPSNRRITALLVALGVVMVVLAGALVIASQPPPPDDRLLVVDDQGMLSLLDPSTGEVKFSVADAVSAPDRSRLYRSRTDGEQTWLDELDPKSGTRMASQSLPGELVVRVISPQGGAVALMPPPAGGRGIYQPEARARTTLVVARNDGTPPRVFRLNGNFEPETFSLDESTLFLIEFRPATAPDHYYVRRLELATGRVGDVYSPEVELSQEMRGRARAQAIAPDGSFLYTLYTSDTGDPIHAHDDEAHWAFVHALSLTEDWSFCIFLPVPFGTEESEVGLGISPDGGTLYAVDSGSDLVARMDTREFEVAAIATVEQLRGENERTPVAVGPDGTLYAGSKAVILAIDPETLSPVAAWGTRAEVRDLDVSADGRHLRIALSQVVTILDLTSGSELATLTAPGRGNIDFLGPPTGHLDEYPVQCAC